MRNLVIVAVGSDTASESVISHPGSPEDVAAGALAVFLADHPETDPAAVTVTATPFDVFDGTAEEPVTASTASHRWITPKWVADVAGYLRSTRECGNPVTGLIVRDLIGTEVTAAAPRELAWPAWDMVAAARTAWAYSDSGRGANGAKLTEAEAERAVWAADEIVNILYRAAQVAPSGRASTIDREAFPELAWVDEAHELACAIDDLNAGPFTRGKAQRVVDAAGAVREIAAGKLRRKHAKRRLFAHVDEVRMRGITATSPFAEADDAGRYAALVQLHDGLEDLAAHLQDEGAHAAAEPVDPEAPWYLVGGGCIEVAIREGLRELYVWTGREDPATGSKLDRDKLAAAAVRLRDAVEAELNRIDDQDAAAEAAEAAQA